MAFSMIQKNIARARKISDECNIFLASAIFSCIIRNKTVTIIIIYSWIFFLEWRQNLEKNTYND